jgi:membrane protein implicated in regulation of membrane protease activity
LLGRKEEKMNDPTGGLLTFVVVVLSITMIIAFFMLVHYAGETRKEAAAQTKLLGLVCVRLCGDSIIGKEGISQASFTKGAPGYGKVTIDGQVWDSFADADIPLLSRVRVAGLRGARLVIEPVATQT